MTIATFQTGKQLYTITKLIVIQPPVGLWGKKSIFACSLCTRLKLAANSPFRSWLPIRFPWGFQQSLSITALFKLSYSMTKNVICTQACWKTENRQRNIDYSQPGFETVRSICKIPYSITSGPFVTEKLFRFQFIKIMLLYQPFHLSYSSFSVVPFPFLLHFMSQTTENIIM